MSARIEEHEATRSALLLQRHTRSIVCCETFVVL